MSSLSLGLGLTSIAVLQKNPLQSLIQAAENAASANGASLWYVPPDSYASMATNGPFVNSDQSGGNPTLGSGLVGWLKDRGQSNPITQATTANKPVFIAAPADATFAGLSLDGVNDIVSAPITTVRYVMLAFKRRATGTACHVGGTINGTATAGLLIQITAAGAIGAQDYGAGNPGFTSATGRIGTSWQIMEVFLNAGASLMKINGVQVASAGATSPTAGSNFAIGNSPAIFGPYANIDVMAAAACSSVVTSTAMAKLAAYITGVTYSG